MEADPEIKRNKLTLQYVNGFPISKLFSQKCFEEAISLEAKPGDIFLGGYPKGGTTWAQYIIWDILNKGAPLPNINDIWTKEFPHLEMMGTTTISSLPSPRLMKVNLPFEDTPYHPSAKYFYVIRNPYDVCVSFYNFMKEVDENYSDATFNEFFESFMGGEIPYGDYFEHVLSWYVNWNDPNFLFISYEGLKHNACKNILQIATFLGKSYYENLFFNPDILTTIVQNTSFDHMKKQCPLSLACSTSSLEPVYAESSNTPNKIINFFHKGTVGQWKDYFNEDQMKQMKTKIEEKLKDTEILSLWKDLDLP